MNRPLETKARIENVKTGYKTDKFLHKQNSDGASEEANRRLEK
jgi:hypothetical protein